MTNLCPKHGTPLEMTRPRIAPKSRPYCPECHRDAARVSRARGDNWNHFFIQKAERNSGPLVSTR
jgi:hypothetical protein